MLVELDLLGVPKVSKLMKSRVEKRDGKFYVYNMSLLMTKVNQMSAGTCFGDLALLSERDNEQRMATVLCTKDSEFAVLDRQSFQSILGEIKNKQMKEQIDAMSIYPVISSLSKDCIKALLYCKKEESYRLNHVLQEIDEPVTRLLLISKGEVAIFSKNAPRKLERKIRLDQSSSEEDHSDPLTKPRGERVAKYSQIKTVIGPSNLLEEYYILKKPAGYRAVVVSDFCETIEIKFNDLSKSLGMSGSDQDTFSDACRAAIVRQALVQKNRIRLDAVISSQFESDQELKDVKQATPVLAFCKKRSMVIAANRLIK